MKHLNKIWKLSRPKKRIISLLIDSLFICMAFYFSFWVRLGEFIGFSNSEHYYALALTLILTLFIFIRLGLYRSILRYLTFHALSVILLGALFSSVILTFFSFYLQAGIPRTVPIIYFSFLSFFCGGSRLVVRSLINQEHKKGQAFILIYGAGNAGRQLALSLRSSKKYRTVAFIDKDKTLIGNIIQGLPVKPQQDIEKLIERKKIKKIFLAVPTLSHTERRKIINFLVGLRVEVLSVPAMEDIVSGKANIDQLGEVSIEDLLGRDPVAPQKILLEKNIKYKAVLVTGAGGSIGSELCRQIIAEQPSLIVLYERSEFALYKIEKELRDFNELFDLKVRIAPILGCIQNINRLSTAMEIFKVNTVYHAAAYKHVPLVEFNTTEGIYNNIFGTYNAAKAAILNNVQSFVLVSTDKAVRPANVMGATKRLAELGLQALAAKETFKANGTRFCMVRFGNVLGSSGSVIPLFKKQIAEGGPITITHPDITRFFMTIPEAAQLVIQAGAMGSGGEVFVLDMGDPVKVIDLATNLVQLSGLEIKNDENPDGDIEIKITGLRPGEKLYEELLIGEDVKKTAHDRIMTANEASLPLSAYESVLQQLDSACENCDHELIRSILLSAPTDFNPTDGISDLLWNEKVSLLRNDN